MARRRPLRHVIRRHVGNLLIDGIFQVGSAAWGSLPIAHPRRVGVERTRDVPYRPGGDRAHLLDVYRPTSAVPGSLLPCVLYVHGGSFRVLSKESHFMMATSFARAGYVVFNINYRLAPRHPFPAAVEDAAAAYRWVVENAARWGADPERLVLAGESAGANLALGLSIMTTYPRQEPYARSLYGLGVVPRALVPFCGILQVSDPRHRRPFPPLIQDRLDAVAEYYLGEDQPAPSPERALADPLLIVEAGPPERTFPATFATVGTRDPVMHDTLRLQAALARHGVPVEARTYRGEPHAFQALTFRRTVQRQWDEVFEFLTRVL